PRWAGPDSAFGDSMYVAANNILGGTAFSSGTVIRIGPDGTWSHFTGSIAEPSYLAFGPGGGFGTNLYLANSSLPPAPLLRVDPAGAVSAFPTPGLRAVGPLAFGPGGTFGTDLFAVDNSSPRTIRKVTPSGAISAPFATFGNKELIDLKFGPGGPFG